MELFREELQGMVYFYYGFCGWSIVFLVFYGAYYWVEKFVKLIKKRIIKHRKAKMVQE